MLPLNIDRYHTTIRTATCNRHVFVGARGWPISSMVTVKIYDNGTYIGNSPKSCVPDLRSRYSKRELYTNLRRQVKQARAANKNGRCTGAAHLL